MLNNAVIVGTSNSSISECRLVILDAVTPRAPGVAEDNDAYRNISVHKIPAHVLDIDEMIAEATDLGLSPTFDLEDDGVYRQLHEDPHFAVKVFRMGALFVAMMSGDKADVDFVWDQWHRWERLGTM
jgi:hypothetical protein